MIGVEGLVLGGAERRRLRHPLLAGVILFARNYRDPAQLVALCAEIRAQREAPLLIAVDHEGGRVQRFVDSFTALPPMARLGEMYPLAPARALQAAADIGWLMGCELREAGLDFSFAPVLDLDRGVSAVIGDRAFAAAPLVVAELAAALCDGLREAGVAAVGKHFPGHGAVAADSHAELPVDARGEAEIRAADLLPFAELARRGIAAMMPAHVLYPAVDAQPAGFSRRWLADILRAELGFAGAIVSDDLDMAGAALAGDAADRAQAAAEAGCDLLLLCNDFAAVPAVLARLEALPAQDATAERLAALAGRGRPNPDFRLQPRHAAAQRWVGLLSQ